MMVEVKKTKKIRTEKKRKHRCTVLMLALIIALVCIMVAVYLVTNSKEKPSNDKENTGENTQQVTDSAVSTPKTYDQVQDFLSGFSNDSEILVDEGCFVNGHSQVVGGLDKWNDFSVALDNREAAELVIAQFTDEGDAVLDYLYYNGKEIYHVCDSTRDGFAGTGDKYYEETFPYLKVFDETASNGDRTKLVVLANKKNLTYDKLQRLMGKSEYVEGEEEFRYIARFSEGNDNSDVTGGEKWHEVAYSYDMSQDLISRNEITYIQVTNGNTGDRKTFAITDGSNTYNEILDLYEGLNAMPDDAMESRSGYAYSMTLLDEEGQVLQRVTPYKDGVSIDWTMYDCSQNGTTTQLLLKLDSLGW